MVRDPKTLDRIRKLAIPPAWTDVWICPDRARPHPGDRPRRSGPQAVPLSRRWRAARDEDKYDRLIAFGRALPKPAPPGGRRPGPARPAAREGAGRRGPAAGDHPDPRRQRGIRQGQQELRPDHPAQPPRAGLAAPARCSSSAARAARSTAPASSDRRLARIVRPARTCPASGCSSTSTRTARRRPVESADVNAYLRDGHGRGLLRQGLPHLGRHAGRRPGAGSGPGPGRQRSGGQDDVITCVKAVAGLLGNTPAVCRASTSTPRCSRPTRAARCRRPDEISSWCC